MIRVNNLNRCGFDGIKTTKLSKKKQRQRQGQNTGNGRMKKMLSSVPKKSISCRSKSTYLSKVECQPIFGFLNHVSSPFFSKTHFFLSHSRFCSRCLICGKSVCQKTLSGNGGHLPPLTESPLIFSRKIPKRAKDDVFCIK